jgi:hypothetical protein
MLMAPLSSNQGITVVLAGRNLAFRDTAVGYILSADPIFVNARCSCSP